MRIATLFYYCASLCLLNCIVYIQAKDSNCIVKGNKPQFCMRRHMQKILNTNVGECWVTAFSWKHHPWALFHSIVTTPEHCSSSQILTLTRHSQQTRSGISEMTCPSYKWLGNILACMLKLFSNITVYKFHLGVGSNKDFNHVTKMEIP